MGGTVSCVSPVSVGVSRVGQGDSVGMRTHGGCAWDVETTCKAGNRCWQDEHRIARRSYSNNRRRTSSEDSIMQKDQIVLLLCIIQSDIYECNKTRNSQLANQCRRTWTAPITGCNNNYSTVPIPSHSFNITPESVTPIIFRVLEAHLIFAESAFAKRDRVVYIGCLFRRGHNVRQLIDISTEWTEAATLVSKPMEAASHALASDTKLRLAGRSSLAGFGSRADLMQRGRTGQVMRMNRERGPDSSGGRDVTGMALFDRMATSGRRAPRHACIHQIGRSSRGVATGSGPVCVH